MIDLRTRRDALLASMMEASSDPDAPDADAERRQFLAGFLDFAIQAAEGDLAPRDEYIALIIPAVRASGVSLGVSMAGMVGLAMGGAVVLEGDARAWWFWFCRDYTDRICAAWEESRS